MAALKVGIIGVGGISRTHMPGWRASEHAEVVAGSDIDGCVLRSWGEEQGVSRLYETPGELFSDREIDIVDICVPNMHHAPLAVAALEAGKHVICEKPLAPAPDLVRQMIAARDKSGKKLMTAQHFRFEPSSRAMKAEIELGVLGDIYHARSWMLRRGFAPTGPGFVQRRLSGGGPCIDIGVHILDLTLWFMGNPRPAAVSGVARAEIARQEGAFGGGRRSIPPEFDVEDFAAAFVRFENGATLVLEVSWLLHHDTAGEDMQMWLYGTAGGLHWPKCEILETDYRTRQFYNRALKLMPEGARSARAGVRRVCAGGRRGRPLAGAGGAVAAGDDDPRRHLPQSGGGGRSQAELESEQGVLLPTVPPAATAEQVPARVNPRARPFRRLRGY